MLPIPVSEPLVLTLHGIRVGMGFAHARTQPPMIKHLMIVMLRMNRLWLKGSIRKSGLEAVARARFIRRAPHVATLSTARTLVS